MAEQSIFAGVLDAVKKNRRKTFDASFTPGLSATRGTTPYSTMPDLKPGSGIENMQQQFLDWQVHKIAHDLYTRTVYFDTDRISAYQDFRAMDASPEIAAALNIIRDECLTRSERGGILEVFSENTRVKEVLNDLFKNVLNADFNLRLWVRDLVKYGDYFVLLNIDKDVGIYDFLTLPMEEVHREEGHDGRIDSVRFRWETTGDYFEEWQVAHFRLLEDSRKLPYGRSILDSSRKLWKQLQLSEDAMLVYRYCLDGETRIRTDNGYKYIKDLNTKDRIISYTDTGELCFGNIVNHINNGEKEVLKIASKHKEIICTKTHPVLVNEDGVIKYVDAQDLKIKKHKLINISTKNINIQEKEIRTIFKEIFAKLDETQRKIFRNNSYDNISQLMRECSTKKYNEDRIKQFLYTENKNIPINIAKNVCEKFNLDSEKLIISNKGQNNSERINVPKYVNEEFAQLFGFLLGDGSIRKNSVCFAGGVNKKINEYYSNLLEKFFGKVNFDLDKRSEHGCGNYTVNSEYASKIFEDLGFIKGAKNKRIPSWVFNCKPSIRKALILGLCDADGCIRHTRKGTWFCTLELCNKKLIEDVKELWSSIGLNSGKLTNRIKKSHIIDKENNRAIKETEVFIITLTQLELPEYENIIITEEVQKRDVYDITVDNKWHNFIANGIPVHNTRAPERRVFYIEVGTLPDADVKTYMGKIQNQVKKQPVVDSQTGNMHQKYNPMNVTEDYFIPIRGDRASKIETLPGACLALDTKIDLLDGRSLELKDIIKEYKEGKQLWSYSINPESGEIVPGKISWAGITRRNTDVVKITLDNGETIIVTPDHKFPTRFNGEKEAKKLEIGESLWSFNKRFKKIKNDNLKGRNDYEQIYDHKSNKWKFTHRVVNNYFDGLGERNEFVYNEKYKNYSKLTIHHNDFDRYNNNPENLYWMNNKDHREYHSDNIIKWSKAGYLAFKEKYDNDIFFRENVNNRLKAARINYYKNRSSEKEIEHNKAISNGIKNYFNNLSEEDRKKRANISKKNGEKGFIKIRELLEYEEYKKEFYKKTSKSLKIVKNTPKYKLKQSIISKELWKDKNYRKKIKEKQHYKYSDELLNFVVELYKNGQCSSKNILNVINSENSWFLEKFYKLNKENKHLKKMDYFTHNNLCKLLMSFGYDNFRDFKEKIECYNHKIVSIEFLDEKIDTGTITIDGNEKYHDFHNFALSCGVFTKNSNLAEIADIEYLQNKLFAALQVPKTYLNFAESMPGGSTLSQADLRFARTINSIQEAVLLELRRVANVHLYFLGFRDDIDNFTLTFTNPSTQQELLKLETMKGRLEVFKEFFSAEATSPTSYTWAMQKILGFSDSEIKLILKQKKVEKKIFAEIDSAVEAYRKIGLFRELDAKFEAQTPEELGEVPPGEEPAAGEGFGAASALGGAAEGGIEAPGEVGGAEMGAGGEMAADLGAAPPGGAPAPGAGAPEAAPAAGAGAPAGGGAPITESEKRKKLHKLLKESDTNADKLLTELLGEDESIIKKKREAKKNEDNVLIEKSNKLALKTEKLIDSLNNTLESVPNNLSNKKIVIEDAEIIEEGEVVETKDDKNVLIEGSEKVINETKKMFEDIDSILDKNNKKND